MSILIKMTLSHVLYWYAGIDKSSEWHKISEEKKKDLQNNNSITAITGATISTKAVSKGIKQYAYKHLSALKSDDKKAVENKPEQEE